MSGSSTPSEHRRGVDEIERDIERTQQEMSRTIDTIQYRLSPDYIKLKAKVRMRETSSGFMDRIKEHPTAAAMIGIGAWMLFRNKESDRELSRDYAYDQQHVMGCGVCGSSFEENEQGFTERMRESASSAGDRARGVAENVRESASNAAHRVSEKTSNAAHRVSEKTSNAAHRVSETTSDAAHHVAETSSRLGRSAQRSARNAARSTARSFEDNPFILGGVGIVLGALLGAAIPETDREREMMGPARDRALDRAKGVAREKVEQVKNVAEAAAGAAVREGKNEARREGLVDDESANRITTP